MAGCIFCNTEEIRGDILWQTENFFAKVGVGILAPGHVMLITKSHISCFGALPPNFDKEFLLAREKLFESVKSNFSRPIIVEHGIYSQSIKHAHLHFLPKKSKLYSLEGVSKKVFSELKSTELKDFFEIRDVFRKEGSYIYLEDGEEKLVFHTKGIPENKFTFRKEFAGLTGVKGLLRWQEMNEKERFRDREWVKETKEKLKSGRATACYNNQKIA